MVEGYRRKRFLSQAIVRGVVQEALPRHFRTRLCFDLLLSSTAKPGRFVRSCRVSIVSLLLPLFPLGDVRTRCGEKPAGFRGAVPG